MKAPELLRTFDGAEWELRSTTQTGTALYAVKGAAKCCPPFVMATLTELAEHGIQSADLAAAVAELGALPLPAGDEPSPPRRGPLWSLLDWSFWGAGMGDVFREPLADAMLAAVPAETRAQAEQIMAEFIERRRIEKTGVTVYQEQRDELAALRARVEELLAERHSTNDALADVTVAQRSAEASADRLTRMLAPVQALREDDDPARCAEPHTFSPRDGWRMVCGSCDHGKDAACHRTGGAS